MTRALVGRRIGFLLTLCTGVFVAWYSIEAVAHMGATGVVKQRMDMMVSMGKAMKSLNAMVRGKTAFDSGAVAAIATQVRDHSAQMARLFPEGSMHKPSEARPEIWSDWEGFKRLASSLGVEANKLAEASATGDRKAVATQFRRMGKVCSSCHKSFRSKKKR